MKPKAYLFDMDGLLLDSERVFLAAGQPLLQDIGMSAAEARAFFVSLVGSSGAHTTARLAEVAGGVSQGAALEEQWRADFRRRMDTHVPLRPTVQETLYRLNSTGARMAVVTSTHGALARHHLQQADLAKYFELVVGGDEVKANKPDPEPYLEAARQMGLKPQKCAAFEDSDRGITSAVRAGCDATQIPDLRAVDSPLPPLGQRVAATLYQAVFGGDAVPV